MNCPPLLQNSGILLFSVLVCAVGLVWSSTFTDRVVLGEERARAAADRVIPALTAELSAKGLQFGFPVFIRLFKEESELEVWVQHRNDPTFVKFKSYRIEDWGEGTFGPKLQAGDGQAPEGFYVIGKRQLNARTSDHLAIDLGFPNVYDRTHERTGSAFVAESTESSNGSYAMSAPAIEELYTLLAAALENGQPFVSVHAFPFRMTSRRIHEASRNLGRWLPFWQNLKSGYDWFEQRSAPPDVIIKERKYHFIKF